MTCSHMTEPLDWGPGPQHWSPKRRPCFLCGAPTNLRNTAGEPAHKVCVERRIAQLRVERVTGRPRTGLYPVPGDEAVS